MLGRKTALWVSEAQEHHSCITRNNDTLCRLYGITETNGIANRYDTLIVCMPLQNRALISFQPSSTGQVSILDGSGWQWGQDLIATLAKTRHPRQSSSALTYEPSNKWLNEWIQLPGIRAKCKQSLHQNSTWALCWRKRQSALPYLYSALQGTISTYNRRCSLGLEKLSTILKACF